MGGAFGSHPKKPTAKTPVEGRNNQLRGSGLKTPLRATPGASPLGAKHHLQSGRQILTHGATNRGPEQIREADPNGPTQKHAAISESEQQSEDAEKKEKSSRTSRPLGHTNKPDESKHGYTHRASQWTQPESISKGQTILPNGTGGTDHAHTRAEFITITTTGPHNMKR